MQMNKLFRWCAVLVLSLAGMACGTVGSGPGSYAAGSLEYPVRAETMPRVERRG